jgi:hypothetical protein
MAIATQAGGIAIDGCLCKDRFEWDQAVHTHRADCMGTVMTWENTGPWHPAYSVFASVTQQRTFREAELGWNDPRVVTASSAGSIPTHLKRCVSHPTRSDAARLSFRGEWPRWSGSQSGTRVIARSVKYASRSKRDSTIDGPGMEAGARPSVFHVEHTADRSVLALVASADRNENFFSRGLRCRDRHLQR